MPRLDRENKQAYDPFLSDRVRELDYTLVGVIPEHVPFTGEINVAGKKIGVVAGDIGGLNAVLPVLPGAIEAGCNVIVFLVGASAKAVLEQRLTLPSGVMHVVCELPETVGRSVKDTKPDLLVLAASQSEIGTNAILRALDDFEGPVLATQDLYGSLHPALRKCSRPAIDVVCVTDEFSKALMTREFGHFPSDIVVTGGPQFDKVAQMKEQWQERRKEIRGNLRESNLLVLIAGQLNGTAEMFGLLAGAAEMLAMDGVYGCIRQHPRATKLDRELTEYVRSASRWVKFSGNSFVDGTNEDILPGVDLVLSGYSTTNYFGILCGMPGIVYCGTPALRWDFWREKRLERPPEVEAGAGWWIETTEDLVKVITELRTTPESEAVRNIREAQQRIAQYNDGHATDRVWGEMQKLLQ